MKTNDTDPEQEAFCLIGEQEACLLLDSEFPQTESIQGALNVYKAIGHFSDLTKHLILKGNFGEVKHCFDLAEKMLLEGNARVRNAVENVFVYSMSSVLDLATPVSDRIRALLNDSLRAEYIRQVNACGI